MKKTVIDEIIRQEVLIQFNKQQAYKASAELLNMESEKAAKKLWHTICLNHPELKGCACQVHFDTWICEYEKSELTREGENVIEEIDPELYEVHTPPAIGIGEGN